MTHNLCIVANNTVFSDEISTLLKYKLSQNNISLHNTLTNETTLLVCIGGDGALLDAVHKFDFPDVPVVGINTGHLGFFQEVESHELDDFIFNLQNNKYKIQKLATVKADIYLKNGNTIELHALNEIIIRGHNHYATHLNLSIGNNFIATFSGDGILVSTPAGSTAYNYSAGGAIADPRLELLQVTPIVPMNTTAYRSFTSSVLLPANLNLHVTPSNANYEHLCIITDGISHDISDIQSIKISIGNKKVNLMRFENYDFWTKVKSKFL